MVKTRKSNKKSKKNLKKKVLEGSLTLVIFPN